MAYALALGLVALVLGARTLLAPTLGNQALYLFLIPSVLIAGIVGGWGPGLAGNISQPHPSPVPYRRISKPRQSQFTFVCSRAFARSDIHFDGNRHCMVR